MMSLKCFQIFTQNILLGSFAGNNIWMLFGIIIGFNSIDINTPDTTWIHFNESLLNCVHSSLRDFSSDFVKEFVIVKSSIFILIKQIKQDWDVLFTNTYFEILACLWEFSDTETSTIIIIHYLEYSLETNHASCASASEFVSEKFEKGCWSVWSVLQRFGCLFVLFSDVWVDGTSLRCGVGSGATSRIVLTKNGGEFLEV